MKIRYIAVIYTLLLLLAVLGGYGLMKNNTIEERDMVFYQEQLTQIHREIASGESCDMLAGAYDCEILLLTDTDYQSKINERIKKGDMILDLYQNNTMIGKVMWDFERVTYQKLEHQLLQGYLLLGLILLLIGYIAMGLLYYGVVRPFHKLQSFTSEIAKGNLDLPLPMERNNFFGAFTESFDIMREELRKAKESEYQANKSKKELVAELSHDIKTPVATIRAACEVMQAAKCNPGTCLEENDTTFSNGEISLGDMEKINVIAGKAEMIDRLISNLFQATLEELEVLKVEVTEESSLCLKTMFEELQFYGEIQFANEIPECLLYMDKLRLQQVIDNIVNNSYKYAGTVITVSFQETEDGILTKVKDYGAGVPEEELALITEKYYRGRDAKGKAGSGLGLYLANRFLNQMHGGMECYTEHNGFTVAFYLKKA